MGLLGTCLPISDAANAADSRWTNGYAMIFEALSDLLHRVRRADPVDRDEIAQMQVPSEPLADILARSVAPRPRRWSARGRRHAVIGAIVGAIAIVLTVAALPNNGDDQPTGATSGLLAAARAAEAASQPKTELLEPVAYTGGSVISYRILVAAGHTDTATARP